MSTNSPEAKPKIGIVRMLFPVVVVVVASAVWLVAHFWNNRETDSSALSMAKMLAVLVGSVMLLLWALRMPGWRKRNVWLACAGSIALFLAFFRVEAMAGNFLPIFVLRDWVKDLFFGGSQDTRLEQHRQSSGKVDGPADLSIQPGDWADFRGPNRDGLASGSIRRDWSDGAPKELWRQPVGGGYAGFAVANGHLVTIEQRRTKEVVACYQASTGKEVWTAAWDARFEERLGGPGPRATPTISQGDVFALGATGRLVCLNGSDGKEKWAVETLANNKNIEWGMSASPLVLGDRVIVNPGAQTPESANRAIRAYDRNTGAELWSTGSNRAGYCSPQPAKLAGKDQVLIFDAASIVGLDPATGQELWRFAWPTYMGINVAQPMVLDENSVFIGSGYGAGGVRLKIAFADGKWSVSETWRTKTTVMRLKFTSPVRRQSNDGDYLYGLNDGLMECLDLKTGKQVWKDDRRAKKGEGHGHGQIVLADDRIVVLTEYGELVLVAATPEGFQELGRVDALKAGEKTWNTPALVGGKIYIRNDAEMACYDLQTK